MIIQCDVYATYCTFLHAWIWKIQKCNSDQLKSFTYVSQDVRRNTTPRPRKSSTTIHLLHNSGTSTSSIHCIRNKSRMKTLYWFIEQWRIWWKPKPKTTMSVTTRQLRKLNDKIKSKGQGLRKEHYVYAHKNGESWRQGRGTNVMVAIPIVWAAK